METRGYKQMQFWIPEDLHRQLTAQLERAKQQPSAESSSSPPTACGVIIITEPDPTGEPGTWMHCGGRCSWWKKLFGKTCKWTSQGPYTWCGCK